MMLQNPAHRLDPREDHVLIPSPHAGLRLFLRHLAPARRNGRERAVLYVHGATFPSALSIAHRFDGWSWRDALCEAEFDVWGLDFHGFGGSDRYPEMDQPAEASPPLCRTADAARQIAAAARHILARQGIPRLSIIAHSWGTMPACHFASEHAALVDRLVLFGAISRRLLRRDERPPVTPAWRIVTLADQWARFIADVPQGEPPVLSHVHFDDWGERYLDSDPQSRTRNPAAVKVPAGPSADIHEAWHGNLPYDPALVTAPVALIRGEWDGLVPDGDARWLFDAFTASPDKRDIKISRATHLMHLEAQRHALYDESIAFLSADAPAGERRPHLPRVGSEGAASCLQ
jgi:pimeloyl-ACP methyl ester carboxylesterase